jgi:hypothetical protein
MAEADEYGEIMAQSLAGNAAAIPFLKNMACYEDGAPPYPRGVLYGVPKGPNQDKRRMANAVALDHGFHTSAYLVWNLSPNSSKPPDPVPPPVPQEPDLDTLLTEIAARVKASQSEANVYFGFAPRQSIGEVLTMLITTDTDAQRQALMADTALEAVLEGPLRTQVENICGRHGFAWAGFVFGSDEMRKRDFNGDFDYWLRPRGTGATGNAATIARTFPGAAPVPQTPAAPKKPPSLIGIYFKRYWRILAFLAGVCAAVLTQCVKTR